MTDEVDVARLSDLELLEVVRDGMNHYHAEVCGANDAKCEHSRAYDELHLRLSTDVDRADVTWKAATDAAPDVFYHDGFFIEGEPVLFGKLTITNAEDVEIDP